MRNTRNGGIEAIHGMYRGGTTSLPITAPNLSFKQFLSRMNQTMQIHTSEHALRQISGNPIVTTKKKRLTNAKNSSDKTTTTYQYNLPDNYSVFVQQLNDACNRGDNESKDVIERLAPGMAAVLKRHKAWDTLECPIETGANGTTVSISLVEEQAQNINAPEEDAYKKLIDHLLGPISDPDGDASTTSIQQSEGFEEALRTFISDISLQAVFTGTVSGGQLQAISDGADKGDSKNVCFNTPEKSPATQRKTLKRSVKMICSR